MSGALPHGEPWRSDGRLPATALAEAAGPLSAYLHVPFCTSRCGYCDFNTYAPGELGADSLVEPYVDAVTAEIALSGEILAGQPTGIGTIFVGGGTPSLLPLAAHERWLISLEETFGLLPGAEISTEANPESVEPSYLAGLRQLGYTRLSLGLQSLKPHVLATLERTHSPRRALDAVGWAQDAGFDHLNLDLIYGTPGESLADWQATLEAVVETAVDHVSAYALIVETGTRLAAQIRRGQLPMTDDDDLADKYELAEAILTDHGFVNYETSNWAKPGGECQHNLAYWHSGSWWGYGAGAHSHVGGLRWWNVKHPGRYIARLADRVSPGLAGETLTAQQRRVERVLLELRLADGLPLEVLSASEQGRVANIVATGLGEVTDDRLRLTRAGRLLADAVIRDLVD
ncbi:MAG: radical SAM family heme chaperone HemW [Propionibacteriaceae bacterium]